MIKIFIFLFLLNCNTTEKKAEYPRTLNDSKASLAIKKILNNQITGEPFRRELITDSKWLIVADETNPTQVKYFSDIKGKLKGIWIYSDFEQYEEAKKSDKSSLIGNFFLVVDGEQFFKNLSMDLDEINMNPHSTLALYYKKQQFPALVISAKSIELEKQLENYPKNKEKISSILYDFPKFYIVVANKKWISAPDTENREPLAVFTSEDAVQKYGSAKDVVLKGKVDAIPLTGKELFTKWSGESSNFISINPKGPTRTLVLPKEIIKENLK